MCSKCIYDINGTADERTTIEQRIEAVPAKKTNKNFYVSTRNAARILESYIFDYFNFIFAYIYGRAFYLAIWQTLQQKRRRKRSSCWQSGSRAGKAADVLEFGSNQGRFIRR